MRPGQVFLNRVGPQCKKALAWGEGRFEGLKEGFVQRELRQREGKGLASPPSHPSQRVCYLFGSMLYSTHHSKRLRSDISLTTAAQSFRVSDLSCSQPVEFFVWSFTRRSLLDMLFYGVSLCLLAGARGTRIMLTKSCTLGGGDVGLHIRELLSHLVVQAGKDRVADPSTNAHHNVWGAAPAVHQQLVC